ncbi:MAG: tetratricopeptide repeat protein [Bacteroidia bacterium]|nr:tetratricopeptide repeat protein [Bacteroidia bacterium]
MTKKLKKSKKKQAPVKAPSKVTWQKNTKWHRIFIAVLGLVLYANTLGHNYAQDDAIVIYDNMFVQEGISGIPGLLSKDTFFGFFKEEGKANLVSGGRYRPLTPIMFAIEWAFFGKNPFIGHLLNVLIYAFLGIILYNTLLLLFKTGKNTTLPLLAVLITALYIAHPIHTEAVANIKGRDEIMTMLGSVLALFFSLRYYDSGEKKWFLFTLLSFFMALLSKENAITFLAVVPLAFMLFRNTGINKAMKATIPFVLSSIIFLVLRTSVLGVDFGGSPTELMNNPFIKFINNSWVPFSGPEKMATIIFTLGKYIQLLVLPHPLVHDYYPRAIDIMHFSDWKVLLSIALYVLMVVMAFLCWKKDKFISFGILFFLITLSIVSNIVFPIGTNMSERFMFMPSLGFSIVLGRVIYKYFGQSRFLLGISGLFILAYSFKTVSRNGVWKDDFTLFTSDVSEDTRSAKLLNAAGGAKSDKASKMNEGPEKTKLLNEAISHLTRAIEIHPTYRNAYLLLGNTHYYAKRYHEAIATYDKCLEISPGYREVMNNFPIILREGGKEMGKIQDFNTAELWLNRAFQMNPQDFETLRLLGITYGIKGQHQKAIEFFEKAIGVNPGEAVVYASMGTAYLNLGDREKSNFYFQKAKEIDPNALNHLSN